MQKSSKSTDLSKNCDGLTRFLWSRQEGCRGDTGHPATLLLLLVHLLLLFPFTSRIFVYINTYECKVLYVKLYIC